ncbi:hypothetical protein [Intrasporangium sp. YIM S08009]|uniref:hypothetical protein n=1 Tax=Intrasporangium zincisolvens TaxID=3080018 RepID=UPI002B05AD34|nr:hypothetical protein [Intrasporangium sp. YIM S08009]
MTILAYPSADFPGLPAVALEVPEEWEPVHAPGTTMATRLPRDGAFAPNVVVSIEQCGPAFRVEESLEQVAAMARSRGGAVSEPYAAELGGAAFVGCDATWPDADVDTVLQANLFHVVPSDAGRPAFLVQLTGAVGGASAETDYELIREVITSVRVTPWSGAGEAPVTTGVRKAGE